MTCRLKPFTRKGHKGVHEMASGLLLSSHWQLAIGMLTCHDGHSIGSMPMMAAIRMRAFLKASFWVAHFYPWYSISSFTWLCHFLNLNLNLIALVAHRSLPLWKPLIQFAICILNVTLYLLHRSKANANASPCVVLLPVRAVWSVLQVRLIALLNDSLHSLSP